MTLGEAYGIRFTDRAGGLGLVGGDILELRVARTLADALVIDLRELNNEAGTISQYGSAKQKDQY